MTGPLSDDPYEGLPTARRGVVREVIAALAILVGLVALGGVLASFDVRLVIGMGAVVLIAGGLYAARGDGGD